MHDNSLIYVFLDIGVVFALPLALLSYAFLYRKHLGRSQGDTKQARKQALVKSAYIVILIVAISLLSGYIFDKLIAK